MAVIETFGLTKSYGRKRGIIDLRFGVEGGEIFGFLGPNGAGKTTTIRTLLGFLRPTAGTARVLGMDIRRESLAIKARVGYVPGDVVLYSHLTGWDHIELALRARRLRGRGRAPELCQRLGADLDRPIRHCSRGLRQQVAIIAGLAHDPDLMIMDEPTAGLDPLVKVNFCDFLRQEKARGKTVFLSSHNLPEVEAVCDRVGIVREGRLAAVERVEDLRHRRLKQVEAVFDGEPPRLDHVPGVRGLKVDGPRVVFQIQGDIRAILRILSESGLRDVRVMDPTLEELFVQFYNRR